jgi:hypothetical protein
LRGPGGERQPAAGKLERVLADLEALEDPPEDELEGDGVSASDHVLAP